MKKISQAFKHYFKKDSFIDFKEEKPTIKNNNNNPNNLHSLKLIDLPSR